MSFSFGLGQQQQTVQQLPYRRKMHPYAAAIRTAVDSYITELSNNDLWRVAMTKLRADPNSANTTRLLIIGTINLIDFLMEVEHKDLKGATETAVKVCVEGFLGKILIKHIGSGSGLKQEVIDFLVQKSNALDLATRAINEQIVPRIKDEANGTVGSSALSAFDRLDPREVSSNRQVEFNNTQSGFGTLMDAVQVSQPKSVGLFNNPNNNLAGTPTTPVGLGFGVAHEPAKAVEVPQEKSIFVDLPSPTQTKQTTQTQTKEVKYTVNYEDHKTYGILKSILPSDATKRPIQGEALDMELQTIAAAAPRKLDNVQRKDVTVDLRTVLEIPTLTISNEVSYGSMVYEAINEKLDLTRRDAGKITAIGDFIQLYPEELSQKAVDLIDEYASKVASHSRIQDLVADLEPLLQPETSLIISKKIASIATTYWRYRMNMLRGKFDNYFAGADDAADSLRRSGKAEAQAIWGQFPNYALSTLFNKIPYETTGENGERTMKYGLGFMVKYIRVPYAALEFGIGYTETKHDAGVGIVSRRSTPGLYNVCKKLVESGPSSTHAQTVLVTSDGRLIEVIQPMTGENEIFYIREIKDLLS